MNKNDKQKGVQALSRIIWTQQNAEMRPHGVVECDRCQREVPARFRIHLTQSVDTVVLQKSTPPQSCQLVLYYYQYI